MDLLIERGISQARQSELGIHGWPTWKDAEGEHMLSYDAAEKSYFLAGSATLTAEDGEAVTVNPGDLVVIPAGNCRWQGHSRGHRHYRSEALSPACCIV